MSEEPLKVLIVDDSRIFRGGIEEALSGREDIRVVGSVWNGEKAIEFARTSLPDFVTLDIEMPGIGGIATLRTLRELAKAQQRPIGVLLISSHTQRGTAVTVEGLQEGAFDFISKPDSPDARANADSLQQQLYAKLDAFRSRRHVSHSVQRMTTASASSAAVVRRKTNRFRAIVIAASTGGPEALAKLLPTLTPVCPVPIFLVQHIPASFTPYFASSLEKRCGTKVIPASEGCIAEPGVVYVAGGGHHLVLKSNRGQIVTGFSDTPPENGCRPAADVLFRSAADVYSEQVLAVVLTGMGSDGAKGAAVLKRAGAYVIVQDEATSVVWGMPGSAVAAKAADEVLPLEEIGPALVALLGIGN